MAGTILRRRMVGLTKANLVSAAVLFCSLVLTYCDQMLSGIQSVIDQIRGFLFSATITILEELYDY